MRKVHSTIMMLAMIVAALSFTACGGDDDSASNQSYDILEINGVNYACYGYRCYVTFSSFWDLSNHSGHISLPCGKLADAQKGEYDYDYMFTIDLQGSQDLQKNSKLEDFSPTFVSSTDMWTTLNYVSGSATVVDKKNDTYVTIKFDSFKFGSGSKSYTLNGTVQLDFDED